MRDLGWYGGIDEGPMLGPAGEVSVGMAIFLAGVEEGDPDPRAAAPGSGKGLGRSPARDAAAALLATRLEDMGYSQPRGARFPPHVTWNDEKSRTAGQAIALLEGSW